MRQNHQPIEILADIINMEIPSEHIYLVTSIDALNEQIIEYNQLLTDEKLERIKILLLNIRLNYSKELEHSPPFVKQYIESLIEKLKPTSVEIPESNSNVVISPGQALLILMRHHQHDPNILDELHRLYLSGPQNEHDRASMTRYFQDPCLAQYQISKDPHVINNDPVRRYFETHLAYETLKFKLAQYPQEHLDEYHRFLNRYIRANESQNRFIQPILEGRTLSQDDPLYQAFKESYDQNIYKEYTHYFKLLNDPTSDIHHRFTQEEVNKLKVILSNAIVAVIVAGLYPTLLPLNIYGRGYFSSTHRGKVMLEGQETTRNMNFGLMKGHMPLPQDDIARSETSMDLLRPSDQATFDIHSLWCQHYFDALVHPYSNAISGTSLCQLRVLASAKHLPQENKIAVRSDSHDLKEYLSLFTAAMLYYGGGHALFEFVAPLSLSEVQEEFKDLSGMHNINLETMFRIENQDAFDKALQDTTIYLQQYLLRQQLNQNFHGRPHDQEPNLRAGYRS